MPLASFSLDSAVVSVSPVFSLDSLADAVLSVPFLAPAGSASASGLSGVARPLSFFGVPGVPPGVFFFLFTKDDFREGAGEVDWPPEGDGSTFTEVECFVWSS